MKKGGLSLELESEIDPARLDQFAELEVVDRAALFDDGDHCLARQVLQSERELLRDGVDSFLLAIHPDRQRVRTGGCGHRFIDIDLQVGRLFGAPGRGDNDFLEVVDFTQRVVAEQNGQALESPPIEHILLGPVDVVRSAAKCTGLKERRLVEGLPELVVLL